MLIFHRMFVHILPTVFLTELFSHSLKIVTIQKPSQLKNKDLEKFNFSRSFFRVRNFTFTSDPTRKKLACKTKTHAWLKSHLKYCFLLFIT